jgi:hypothetical protein
MAGGIAGGEDVMRTVFRQVDIVKQFKTCWRIRTYYINRATRAWALAGDIEIEPVLFRGNLDGYEWAAGRRGHLGPSRAEPLFTRIRIGAMVWPPDTDPTASMDVIAMSERFPIALALRHRVTWMELLMNMHAAHIRHLSVRMSLCLDLSPLHTPGMDVNALGLGWKYERAKDFLAAFAQCTAIEQLSIEQSDYVQNGYYSTDMHTVQVKVLELIKKMQGLRSLEWNGNTVSCRQNLAGAAHFQISERKGSLCDFLGPSVRELYIKDGPEPRMDAWRDLYGMHAAFGNLMANNDKEGMTLETLYMPRSFWSLAVPNFNAFIRPINYGSLARIGFADPFTLMEGPTETMVNGHFGRRSRRVQNPPPHLTLYHLITHVSRDITIDIRVKKSTVANTERAVRIAWLESIPVRQNWPHTQFWQAQRDDSEESTIFSFSKLHQETSENFTVRVLV